MRKYNFIYNPVITGQVMKTEAEQNDFYKDGHPAFLFDEFHDEPYDIWVLFGDFLEFIKNEEIWEDDGGAIEEYKILDSSTGLSECRYEAWGVYFQRSEPREPTDINVYMKGYIVDNGDYKYFAVTELKFEI